MYLHHSGHITETDKKDTYCSRHAVNTSM